MKEEARRSSHPVGARLRRTGRTQRHPAHSTLIFEVELIKVVKK